MNAKEARLMSIENFSQRDKALLQKVEDEVLRHAKLGVLSCEIKIALTPSVISELKRLGYDLHFYHREHFKISW